MIILDKSFKELFKDFCTTNNIENMQVAIQYFTVFGGLDIKIDTTKPILELIEKHILSNYNYLRSEVNQITGGYHVEHAILSGIALGDRKTTNAFKRAHVSFEEGMKCVDSLYEKARTAGAAGGKLLGAGGGGFILLYCDEQYQQKVRNALDLRELDFKISRYGSRVVYFED